MSWSLGTLRVPEWKLKKYRTYNVILSFLELFLTNIYCVLHIVKILTFSLRLMIIVIGKYSPSRKVLKLFTLLRLCKAHVSIFMNTNPNKRKQTLIVPIVLFQVLQNKHFVVNIFAEKIDRKEGFAGMGFYWFQWTMEKNIFWSELWRNWVVLKELK